MYLVSSCLPPWFETHILVNPASRALFKILYLHLGFPNGSVCKNERGYRLSPNQVWTRLLKNFTSFLSDYKKETETRIISRIPEMLLILYDIVMQGWIKAPK